MLPETDERYAERIAERLKKSMETRSEEESMPSRMVASIGIACFPHDGANAEDLLESAEQDLKFEIGKRK